VAAPSLQPPGRRGAVALGRRGAAARAVDGEVLGEEGLGAPGRRSRGVSFGKKGSGRRLLGFSLHRSCGREGGRRMPFYP
jgi:hypothetical protein